MKTIDEVIESLEICSQMDADCQKCLDHATAKGWCEEKDRDALHYLQEYRAEKASIDILRGNYEDAIKNCEKAENKFIAALKRLDVGTLNNPLTWDELKQKVGKPVWVEFEKNGNHWLIITDVKQNGVVGLGMYGENVPLYQDTIGKTWQAYRKER